MNRRECLIALSLAATVTFAGAPTRSDLTSVGQEQARLHKLENQIDDSTARQKKLSAAAYRLKGETDDLQEDLVRAAARIQAKETYVLQSEQQLDGLEEVEQKKREQLDRRASELSKSLAALQRLSRQPRSAFLTRPETALSAVRSASLLGAVVPDLRVEAIELGEEIKALNTLRREILHEREKLAEGIAQLRIDRRKLDKLVAKKRQQQHRMSQQALDQAKHAKQLASKAKSVRDLIGRLNAAQKRRFKKSKNNETQERLDHLNRSLRGGRPITTARGTLPLPVRGRIASGFGQPDKTGSPLRGITIETLDGAQVTAPYDGQIVYAGPFRDYGQLLIIAHGEGYHTLLAGMSRIDGIVGQWVLAGDPIGHMRPEDTTKSSIKKPNLYVELRRHGEPINPLPWLTANNRKVAG